MWLCVNALFWMGKEWTVPLSMPKLLDVTDNREQRSLVFFKNDVICACISQLICQFERHQLFACWTQSLWLVDWIWWMCWKFSVFGLLTRCSKMQCWYWEVCASKPMWYSFLTIVFDHVSWYFLGREIEGLGGQLSLVLPKTRFCHFICFTRV